MRADLLHSLRTVTRQRDIDALQQATLAMLCDCSGARSALLFVGHEAGEACERGLGEALHCIALPLFHDERRRGVVTLHFDAPAAVALTVLRELLQVVDDFHAVLHAGEHDQLTGLLNRRTFEAKLAALLRLQRQLSQEPEPSDGSPARRHVAGAGESSWIAIADIDRFKRINDTYGHLIGDEVILLLARLLRRGVRRGDLLFRFGGEEFVVILAPTAEANAHLAFERLRASVEATTFPMVGDVTVSIGFTRIADGDNSRAALDRADQALYHVKQTGRNRAECHESLLAAGVIEQQDKSGEIELF